MVCPAGGVVAARLDKFTQQGKWTMDLLFFQAASVKQLKEANQFPELWSHSILHILLWLVTPKAQQHVGGVGWAVSPDVYLLSVIRIEEEVLNSIATVCKLKLSQTAIWTVEETYLHSWQNLNILKY